VPCGTIKPEISVVPNDCASNFSTVNLTIPTLCSCWHGMHANDRQPAAVEHFGHVGRFEEATARSVRLPDEGEFGWRDR
jgi:hypothetical protein